MIDYIVVVQSIVAGLIMHRCLHEPNKLDRAGFALLASTAGLMTIRRVTASLDRYTTLDRVILPNIITWFMLASATLFVLEVLRRSAQAQPLARTRVLGAGTARFFWPFALMLLMGATDFVPVARPWGGERIRELTAEDALREALDGVNRQAACEAVRRHSARGIDALRVVAGAGDTDEARAARQKLRALASRINESLATCGDQPVLVPPRTVPAAESK